jgi:hypothetical protein
VKKTNPLATVVAVVAAKRDATAFDIVAVRIVTNNL